MRLPVHADGRHDRQDQRDAAGLARAHRASTWWAASGSPTCSPWAASSTTRPTSRRCCGCRARSPASRWNWRPPTAGGCRSWSPPSVKTAATGEPLLIRTTVFDARDRRAYETGAAARPQGAEEAAERGPPRPGDRRTRPGPAAAGARHPAAQPAARRRCRACPASRPRRTTTPRPPTSSAATSTTCSRLDDGRWAFFLGDVCGKGAEAAALTSLTRYTLRAAALHDPDPVQALSTLNTVLHERYTGTGPPLLHRASSACSPRTAAVTAS